MEAKIVRLLVVLNIEDGINYKDADLCVMDGDFQEESAE